ncbi:hypothetical protein JCM9534A_13040 [Catenuloplanes indicus JCM 9534]
MNQPTDMAFDPAGNLYVADTQNCAVEKITPAGQLSVFVGTVDGCVPRNGNTFYDRPVSLAWLKGNLYIGGADDGWIYRADANGNLTHFAGTGVQGSPLNGQVDTPTQMTAYGNWLYFGDEESHVVARIDVTQSPPMIEVIAGDGNGTPTQGVFNQPATLMSIPDPRGVAVDSKGSVYISDTKASRILKVASTGELLSEWMFFAPVGLHLDQTGAKLYATSAYGVIAEVDTMDGAISVIAGIGHGASIDQLTAPEQATDVEPVAVAAQIAAQGGYAVTPGPALTTEVGVPAGVEVAANGDVYSTLMYPGMVVKLVRTKPPVPPFTGPDTPVVTAAPSVTPSVAPSVSPSASPSVAPTSAAPSVVPTTPGPVVTSPVPNPADPPRINLNLQLAVDAPLQGARATVSGGGLQPSSPYTLTMYSTPVEVARGTTNAAGAFNAVITMPAKACVKGGAHRLVLTGTAPGGAKLEDSSYVVLDDTCKAKSINNVTAPVNNTVTLQSFTFPHLSAKLRPKAQRTLRDLRGALTSAKAITITGYTETDSRGKAATKANKRLALKRANAVRAHLRKLGVTAPISTVGAGGVNGLGKGQKFNRRVVIVVRY